LDFGLWTFLFQSAPYFLYDERCFRDTPARTTAEEAQLRLSNMVSTALPQNGAASGRRALIIADSEVAGDLSQTLTTAGYETLLTTNGAAVRSISLFTPDVCLMILEPGSSGAENDSIALARRLRAEPATYARPRATLP
jgi:hypothetical protein